MAEVTLQNVIERMKAEGQLTRDTGTNSLKVAIGELGGIKSHIQTLSEDLKLAFQDLIVNQQAEMENEKERLARNRREDVLKDKPKKETPEKTNMKGLIDSIKGLNPKKISGLFGGLKSSLLLGGLAAVAAFAPNWIKENVLNPIIDSLAVLDGEAAKTTLGKVVETIKGGFKWISENLGPEAAWVVGLVGLAAALKPLTTLSFGLSVTSGIGSLAKTLLTSSTDLSNADKKTPKGGWYNIFDLSKTLSDSSTDLSNAAKKTPKGGWAKALSGIARFAGPLGAIALAAYGAKEALDYFRGQNIESEIKKSKEALDAYKAAVKSGNDALAKEIADEQKTRLERLKNTTISNVEAIRDPIAEILADAKKYAEEARSEAAKKFGGATDPEGNVNRRPGVFGDRLSEAAAAALNESKKATDTAAAASFESAKTADEMKAALQSQIDKIMQDATKLKGESKDKFIKENLKILYGRFDDERQNFFQGRGKGEFSTRSSELFKISGQILAAGLGLKNSADSEVAKMIESSMLKVEKANLSSKIPNTPEQLKANPYAPIDFPDGPPAMIAPVTTYTGPVYHGSVTYIYDNATTWGLDPNKMRGNYAYGDF